MNLMWFEIMFSEVDLNRGKQNDLITDTKKLYRILDNLEGLTLYSGTYKKNHGQKYFLTIPDNPVGRNLLQYLKLKLYKPCLQPEQGELNFICGSHSVTKVEQRFNEPLIPNYIHSN
jgi:hypothetical protein